MEFHGRVLLLTGRMAYDNLVRITSDMSNLRVAMLPISVAAFTTPRLVARHIHSLLEEWNPDLILVSGLANGDYTGLSDEIGVPIRKGTQYLSALSLLLRNLHDIEPLLSGKNPADSIIRMKLLEELRGHISRLENEVTFGTRNFKLRSGLPVGIDFPPRVMAEVVDAPSRPFENGVATAQYYSQWADIIDIGATVKKPDPEGIAEMVTAVRKIGLPVSVDSLDSDEILAGVDAGAEIVLSIDRGNLDVIQRIPEDVVLVCLPTNVSAGIFPRAPVERARTCIELCNELRLQGHDKLLADPLMEAPVQPGFMESLSAYHQCRTLDVELPFLAGFGNVTEFVDTDTAGVNTLLACLGIELGVSVFLSTEERPSTFGCTRELKSAAMMGFISKTLETPPKQVGVTTFVAKSSFFDVQSVSMNGLSDFISEKKKKYNVDPSGSFRIGIDHRENTIFCEHTGRGGTIHRLMSKTANALLQEILNRDYVSRLDHAAYLGCELTKAEISLKTGHNYKQDESWDVELTLDV